MLNASPLLAVLVRCPAIQHGLATIDGELVSIGGKVSGRATNMVYTLANGKWKAVIPPMPTPRYLPSTVSYNNDIILAAAGMSTHFQLCYIEKSQNCFGSLHQQTHYLRFGRLGVKKWRSVSRLSLSKRT